MKASPFIICCFLFCISACGQIQWQNATNWKLYQIDGHRLFKIPSDSLSALNYAPLPQDSVNFYMSGVVQIHPKDQIVWMGGYVASCMVEGKLRKLEISDYGGYFFDQAARAYYQVPADKVRSWTSFMEENYLRMLKKGL